LADQGDRPRDRWAHGAAHLAALIKQFDSGHLSWGRRMHAGCDLHDANRFVFPCAHLRKSVVKVRARGTSRLNETDQYTKFGVHLEQALQHIKGGTLILLGGRRRAQSRSLEHALSNSLDPSRRLQLDISVSERVVSPFTERPGRRERMIQTLCRAAWFIVASAPEALSEFLPSAAPPSSTLKPPKVFFEAR